MGFLFGQQSLFADKRVPKKRIVDTTSPAYKKMVSNIIKNRFSNSEAIKSMQTEKEYQKYLKEKKKDEQWKRFNKEIG